MDIYTDSAGNVHDLSHYVKCGWLTKESEWLKAWRKRWFILLEHEIFFCENEKKSPHGMILLSGCETARMRESKEGWENLIEIVTKEKSHILCAESKDDAEEWITSINYLISQIRSNTREETKVSFTVADSDDSDGDFDIVASVGSIRPKFVDQNGDCFDTLNPYYKGWLSKQNLTTKKWRRRFVIVKGDRMFVSKGEWRAPYKMLDMSKFDSFKHYDNDADAEHGMIFTLNGEDHAFHADSENEKEEWVGKLAKLVMLLNPSIAIEQFGIVEDDNGNENVTENGDDNKG